MSEAGFAFETRFWVVLLNPALENQRLCFTVEQAHIHSELSLLILVATRQGSTHFSASPWLHHSQRDRVILKSTRSGLWLMPLAANKALCKELLANHSYFYRDTRISYPNINCGWIPTRKSNTEQFTHCTSYWRNIINVAVNLLCAVLLNI